MIAAAGVLLTTSKACEAQQNSGPAIIRINAAKNLGPVNRLVFGDNIEAADPRHLYEGVSIEPSLHTGDGFWDDQKRQPVPFVVQSLKAARLGALRYPGGSLANLYDWHMAVGPLASRGDWHFGIDEYIETCRAIGAEPQFIVSDYTGTAKDDADLVQYLNARAVPAHPWAMLRAKCGHAQPYHVRLFELGNETDNGGGYPRRTFSAEEYVAYANAAIKAMRSVDPSVKIGIISATGKPVDDPWNPIVFRGAGKNADFVVVHNYAVGQDTTSPSDLVMRGCMASADQFEAGFRAYHALILKEVGHDLPLALTEYNGGFDAPNPPYRFSLGAALFCADLTRVLLKPSSHILMANYWQAVNGYWGMLRGEGDSWTTMPAFPLRKLWGEHFGSQLLSCAVQSPTVDFEGVQLVKPAKGTVYVPAKDIPGNLLNAANLDPSALAAFGASVNGGTLSYDLKNVTVNQYPTLAALPMPTGTAGLGAAFTMSYDIRATSAGVGKGSLSLGMMDARGWEATHSAARIGGAAVDGAWHHCTGRYASRPDTQSVIAVVRVEDPDPAINARVEIKNLRVTASTSAIFPAYPLITSTASLSADGKTIYVIVFNKSTDKDIPVTLDIQNARVADVKRWSVTGPNLECTATGTGNVNQVETGVDTPSASSHSITHVFASRSMSALEIHLKS